MNFFTKDAYFYQARTDVPDEILERCTKEITAAYSVHLDSIRDRLPQTLLRLSRNILHDGIVRTVSWPYPDELALELDTQNCPWGPRGNCIIRFQGIKVMEGIDDIEGAAWIYEEVYLHDEAQFGLRVLLASGNSIESLSEIHIVASHFSEEISDTSAPTTIGVDIPFQDEDGLIVWTGLDEFQTVMGWCLIKDGNMLPITLSSGILEKMKQFAKTIGAVVPGI